MRFNVDPLWTYATPWWASPRHSGAYTPDAALAVADQAYIFPPWLVTDPWQVAELFESDW